MSKKKYSEKKIGEIVRQYEEGVSPGQLEKIHGIHHRTIEGWIIKYKINGLSAFQEEKHNRHYDKKCAKKRCKRTYKIRKQILSRSIH